MRTGAVDWKRAAAWRSQRHHLDARVTRRRSLRVVSELCGLHAQVLSCAELSWWARVDGLRSDDLRRALWTDRSLVKMWAMRGTLHVLPADEHPLWRAAVGTFGRARRDSWGRYFGLTPAEMDRLIATMGDALDGRELTRAELATEVARRHRSKRFAEAFDESWGGILKPASYEGVLCFAPGSPPRVRFTNPRSWLGVDGDGPEPDDAVRAVFRRFLASYGPVSREEIARWWAGGSLAASKAERIVRSLGDEVEPIDVEGTETWALARDVEGLRGAEPVRSVRLLPGFDQYVIGSTKHTLDLMPGAFRDRVHRPSGWVSPVLAVDGRIEGVWSHTRTRGRVSISIEPFVKQPTWVRKGATEEGERLAAFLGAPAEISWSGP